MFNFKKSSLALAVALVVGWVATPALAARNEGGSARIDVAVDAFGAGSVYQGMTHVRKGADDAAGDDRGGRGRGRDDGAGHAKNGADDAAGDDRGGRGRGRDDGAGHAKNGADDAAGDDRGGRGRGRDDGAGHA